MAALSTPAALSGAVHATEIAEEAPLVSGPVGAGGAAERPASDCGLRESAASLERRVETLESKSAAWQIQVAPWVALTIVGLVMAAAWYATTRARDLASHEEVLAQRRNEQLALLLKCYAEPEDWSRLREFLDRFDPFLKAAVPPGAGGKPKP